MSIRLLLVLWLFGIQSLCSLEHSILAGTRQGDPPSSSEVDELPPPNMFGDSGSNLKPGDYIYEDLVFHLKPDLANMLEESTAELKTSSAALKAKQSRLEKELKDTERALSELQLEYATQVEQVFSIGQLRQLTEYRYRRLQPSLRSTETRSMFVAGLTRVRESHAFSLREGVPRSVDDEEVSKLMKDRTVERHQNFPFYADPLEAPEERFELLLSVCLDPNNYHPYRGQKFCGGFHPDLMIESHHGIDTLRLLVCLGCREVMLVDNGVAIHQDLTDHAYQRVQAFAKEMCKRHAFK